MKKDEEKMCLICGKKFNSVKLRNNHLKKEHNISFEDYVIKIYYNGVRPLCKCGCGISLKFKPLARGPWFKEYTRNHWPHKKHSELTKKKIKENTKKAIKNKYGVENVFLLKEIKKKAKQTKLKKYDDENYNNVKAIRQTKLKKYGDENYRNEHQIKQTNIKKYGVEYVLSNEEIKNKIKQTKLKKYGNEKYNNLTQLEMTKQERYGYRCEFLDSEFRKKFNTKTSKIEREVAIKLNKEHNAQHKFFFGGKEFDILLNDDNIIFEIDGDFWHPKELKNLTLSQINSIINDKEKDNIISNSNFVLYKIHVSELPEIISKEDLINSAYTSNLSISHNQVIISKKYFENYIQKRGKDKLQKYIPLLLKFIRTFQPKFPYPPGEECLDDIINKIKHYDFSKIQNNNIFRNNCSWVGLNYLKSHHKSYWKSSYKNNKSPVEAWNDDKLMKNIIKYRIGINNSNEIFDFTYHQLIRGLSAMRFTISFFKPIVAAAIYKNFLGDKINPTVIDPCAGFGGRMLGFKSIYPNGKYIGIESNKETYDELIQLSKSFNNIELHNCKLEDYTGTKECDLTFTSIPYFDTEIYSNNIKYKSFDDWVSTFIKSLQTFSNKQICMSRDISDQLGFDYKYKISNNTSHFDKDNQFKYEIITNMNYK
jgi:hypothetical protein